MEQDSNCKIRRSDLEKTSKPCSSGGLRLPMSITATAVCMFTYALLIAKKSLRLNGVVCDVDQDSLYTADMSRIPPSGVRSYTKPPHLAPEDGCCVIPKALSNADARLRTHHIKRNRYCCCDCESWGASCGFRGVWVWVRYRYCRVYVRSERGLGAQLPS